MSNALPEIAHVAEAAKWDGRPALPRSPCRLHEPPGYWSKMLEKGLARRADVPCPACWLSEPLPRGQAPRTRYIKLLRRPRAEVGKGGVGLKVQIDLQQRIEYEARPVGSGGHLAWFWMRA